MFFILPSEWNLKKVKELFPVSGTLPPFLGKIVCPLVAREALINFRSYSKKDSGLYFFLQNCWF